MNFEELQGLVEAKYKIKPFYADDCIHSAIGDPYDSASKFLDDLVSNLKNDGYILDETDKRQSVDNSTKSYGDAKLVKREFAIIDEDEVVRLNYSNGTKIYIEVSTYNENYKKIDNMSIEQVLIDYALYAEK